MPKYEVIATDVITKEKHWVVDADTPADAERLALSGLVGDPVCVVNDGYGADGAEEVRSLDMDGPSRELTRYLELAEAE